MKYLLSMLLVLICFSKSSYSQELSETDKLFATCKVWGYLKYYHPKVAAGKFDFDRKLFELLSQIEKSSSKEEFSRTLTDWIITFGKIKSNPKSPNENYFDKNFNLEWTKNEQCFSPELTEIFKDIENNRHQGKKHYVSAHQTSGYAIMTNESEGNDLSWESKEYRLLCLFRYWNFVEYFFPYKYQTDTDWDSVLMESIPEFLEAKTETEYHLAILSLVASVDDSHASFITKQTFNYFGNKFVPFNTSIINGKAIVTELLDEALCEENDIRKGDIISTVNGKSIEDLFNENRKYIMGSNVPAQLAKAHVFIFKGNSDEITVILKRDQFEQTKTIKRYEWSEINKETPKNIQKFQILEDNIGYLNLGNIEKEEFDDIAKNVLSTNSLIIDLRYGLNKTSQLLAKFITSKESHFYSSIHPCLDYPGRYIWSEGNSEKGENIPDYKGKVILLVNESTQSNSEFTAMWLQTGENVVTVGSQTSGADGNVTEFKMPGGIPTRITGIGIFYPDGTETQRTGIKIDVVVNPTIEGLVAGKDEQLEKAIEVATNKN